MVRRRPTPDEALVEQGWAVHAWLSELEPDAFARPTVLPGRDVHALLGQLLEIETHGVALEAQNSPRELLDRLADTLTEPSGGPADLVALRVVALVVHSDDLSRSFPERAPVPLLRPALGVASRTLANVLAARYPGRSVEVRIPPYAAVQCSAVRDGVLDPGPTHTRGTPPNVVETDAVTFLRFCTGRTSWADALASGAVAASGLRADLSEMVPLLG